MTSYDWRPSRVFGIASDATPSNSTNRVGRLSGALIKSGLPVALAVCGMLASFGPARAANLQALEQSSGLCGTQGVCFVPDAEWISFSSSYTALTDTVTGNGTFSVTTAVSGTQKVYITAFDGQTVIDVLNMIFTPGSGAGTEDLSASWQAHDGGAIDLGDVPSGGTFIIGDGTLQDLTSLLAGQGGFPLGIQVQAQDVPTLPEPASIALLGFGLAGLGAIRRRRRA